MSDASLIKAARIRELNDQLRCKGIGGRVVITIPGANTTALSSTWRAAA
jgi:hypothetical protein